MNQKINKILVALTYLMMIVVNGLANSLPINNKTTGGVSDSYPNLFAPAGITFSIWGIIYLLLLIYVLYQFGVFGKLSKSANELALKVNKYFIITSLANIAWIFTWHYDLIGLSVVLMLIILLGLIQISLILAREKLKGKEYYIQRLPFSTYFGWISIATIANITTYLVSLNWNGFGITNNAWMIIILLIGASIGIITTIKNRDVAYALVLIWAYAGIIIKHTSPEGHANNYPLVILTTIICIVAIIVTIALLFFHGKKPKKSGRSKRNKK